MNLLDAITIFLSFKHQAPGQRNDALLNEAWGVIYQAGERAALDRGYTVARKHAWQPTQVDWKIVPTEPTKEMIQAAQHTWQSVKSQHMWEAEAAGIYRAMLAAAPEPESYRQQLPEQSK